MTGSPFTPQVALRATTVLLPLVAGMLGSHLDMIWEGLLFFVLGWAGAALLWLSDAWEDDEDDTEGIT